MFTRRNLITLSLLSIPLLLVMLGTEWAGDRLLERIAITFYINLILVLGLQVFMGNAGILSFAHIGFMGVGAYSSALLSIPLPMKSMALPDLYPLLQGVALSPYLAILLGALMASVLAALVSYPLMRLSDAAAVITSFALLVVLHTIMIHWSSVTNGPRTLFGIPHATHLYPVAGAAWLSLLLSLWFKESRFGLLLRAVRDDEVAAAGIGANAALLRWCGFVLSALLAGLAGGLWAHFITSFSPNAFYLKETFVILGMLVIGGAATVSGAVVGALVVTAAYEGLRALENALNMSQLFTTQVVGLTEIVLACAMIGILILRPGGLLAVWEIGDWPVFKKPLPAPSRQLDED
jgi:branched-chain amino acid transport system permease protein